NLSAHERRSHNERGNDLNEQIVASREESDIAADSYDLAEIGGEIGKLIQQPAAVFPLAMSPHDRFGVFAHVNEAQAEAGLLVELIIVQFDQRAPERDRHERPASSVSHRHDEQQG